MGKRPASPNAAAQQKYREQHLGVTFERLGLHLEIGTKEKLRKLAEREGLSIAKLIEKWCREKSV